MFVPIVIVILHSNVYLRSSTPSHKIGGVKCAPLERFGEKCAPLRFFSFFFSPFFPSEWIEKNWTVTLRHIESRARKDENTTEEESWRRRYRRRHYVGFLARIKIFETL
jgi:hypothetical protein